MKRTLCVTDLEQIVTELAKNPEATTPAQMVSRDICENPENKFYQLIPYVIFYRVDEELGAIEVISYTRVEKNNEERLAGKVSLGFGGHIDLNSDIVCNDVSIEDDKTIYNLTSKEIVETCIKAANREIEEELKLNIDLNNHVTLGDVMFFMGDQSKDVNKVHLGALIPVKLTELQFYEYYQNAVFNEEEIQSLDKMSVNFENVVNTYNIEQVCTSTTNELKEKSNMEDWSVLCLTFIIRKEFYTFMKTIDYRDMLKIRKEKQQIQDDKNNEEQQVLDFTEEKTE